MIIDMHQRQYEEALADPNHVELAPGVIMRPFHQPIEGTPQEFHLYCEAHIDLTLCAPEPVIREAAERHVRNRHAQGSEEDR